MSDIYNGPAHIILDNGGEIPATADLRSVTRGLHADWIGVLTAAPQHRVVLANTTSARLRLKDGREGGVIFPERSTWITAGQASIQGNGDAPF